MVAFGNQFDLDVKCDVNVGCPVCQRKRMQLVWGRQRYHFFGIPMRTTGEGFYLKCARCRNGETYGPISADLANELQEKDGVIVSSYHVGPRGALK